MEKIVVNFKADKEAIRKLDIIAKSEGKTRSEYLNFLVMKEIDNVMYRGLSKYLHELKTTLNKPDGFTSEELNDIMQVNNESALKKKRTEMFKLGVKK